MNLLARWHRALILSVLCVKLHLTKGSRLHGHVNYLPDAGTIILLLALNTARILVFQSRDAAPVRIHNVAQVCFYGGGNRQQQDSMFVISTL